LIIVPVKILAFGMGLIHKPKLLLFDEPFAGVDINNTNTLVASSTYTANL
jgi:ABC-type multidrug transport system ATPase subunit